MASTVTAMPSMRMSEAEWQTRLDLAACYRLVDLFGWSDLINTRITARVPGDHDHFLINPFVLHTHSIAGCAVSMQRDGLLSLNQHALQVIGDVAYHDYEGAGRNPEERARLLADLGHRHILVLRNHGLLIVGTSIAAAFVATYRMERACAMQLAFQQSGAG